MLDRMVEKAHQEGIFSREDTPTEQRVMTAFSEGFSEVLYQTLIGNII